MIKWFGRSLITQISTLLVVLLLLWAKAFVVPTSMPEPTGFAPLYGLLYQLLSGNPIVASCIGILTVLLTGYLFNNLIFTNKLIPQGSLQPMFLYVVAACGSPEMMTLHPMHLANLCTVGCLYQTRINTQKIVPSTDSLATLTSLIVIAAMFCTPYLLLLVGLFFIVPAYKVYDWKSITALLLGILAPLIPLTAYYGATGRLEEMLLMMSQSFSHPQLLTQTKDWTGIVTTVLFVFMMIPAIGHFMQVRSNKSLHMRKNMDVVSYLTICSILILPYTTIFPIVTVPFAFGFSMMANFYLTHKADSKLLNAIVVIWVGFSIVRNLFS